MKKILALVLSILFACSAFSCGSNNASSQGAQTTLQPAQSTEVKLQSTQSTVKPLTPKDKFKGAMEDMMEYHYILVYFVSNMVDIMLSMSDDDVLDLYGYIGTITYDEDFTFEKSQNSYNYNPNSVAGTRYQVMVKYFGIESQDDLDDWRYMVEKVDGLRNEIVKLGEIVTENKDSVVAECYDACFDFYKYTKFLSETYLPESSEYSAILAYMIATSNYMELAIEARDVFELYLSLDPDFSAALEKIKRIPN